MYKKSFESVLEWSEIFAIKARHSSFVCISESTLKENSSMLENIPSTPVSTCVQNSNLRINEAIIMLNKHRT